MRRLLLTVLGLAAALGLAASPAAAAAPACKLNQHGVLDVTMEGLQPQVDVEIDGAKIRMTVDSGAFYSTLDRADAVRLGMKISPVFGMTVRGVGGEQNVYVAVAKSFKIANATVKDIEFLVIDRAPGGAAGLLGQNLLSRYDVEYDLANGVIRILLAEKCGRLPLAYWSQEAYSTLAFKRPSEENPHIVASGSVNGQPIKVLFDTGAPLSMLTLRAAAKAGVKPDDQGVQFAGMVGGIGPRRVESWTGPFASFAIGGEEIRNTRLRLGAIDLEQDMLLGADFFLSHRVLVANSQSQIYFTYNGGRVFRLDADADSQVASSAAAAPAQTAPATNSNAPTDADGFARRASASAARRDFAAALADLDKAIELAPDDPNYLAQRANVLMDRGGDPRPAIADLDRALDLKPDLQPALAARGRLHLARGDVKLAKADFDAAVRLDPDNALGVGMLYEQAEHFELAVEALTGWIAANPKHKARAMALNGRCWTRALWRRQLDEALADCDAALKLEPRNASIIDTRGLVHLARGELDAALADYNAALRIRPNLAGSLYGRGLAQLKKGARAEGEADIAQATQIDASDVERLRARGFAP